MWKCQVISWKKKKEKCLPFYQFIINLMADPVLRQNLISHFTFVQTDRMYNTKKEP